MGLISTWQKFVFAGVLASCTVGAIASCGDSSMPVEAGVRDHDLRTAVAQRPSSARSHEITLPDLQARMSFHEIGPAIVGGGETYDIRAQAGEVMFVPGERRADGRIIAGSPLRLRTKRVGRADGAGRTSVEQEAVGGALHIRHEHGTETWVNGSSSAEQSFLFDVRPKGEGDIVVEIETSGLECVESTSAGLRFVAKEGGPGVLYGHGTFIDNEGIDTSVPASCSAGRIILRVPAAVVEAAAFPAVLDPIVAPSFELTTPVPVSGNGEGPVLACSDATCLLGFVDERDGTNRRYVGRFTPGGTILDELPQILGGPVTSGPRDMAMGSVQDRFLVVYHEGTALYGQMIGEEGTLLAPRFAIASNVPRQRFQITCGAVDCLVSWTQPGATMANRIALDGSVLDGTGIVISTTVDGGHRVVWSGGRYFVAHVQSNVLNLTRIENGVLLPSLPVMPAGAALAAMASDGSSVFVMGYGFFLPGQGRTYAGTIVSAEGAVLPPGQAFNVAVPASMTLIDVVWNGTDYGVIYQLFNNTRTIRTFHISSAGAVNPATTEIWSGAEPASSLTVKQRPSGGVTMAFEIPAFSLVNPLYALSLDDTGQLAVDAFPVAMGHDAQSAPDVAAGGGQYLAAWFDRRLTSAYVMATRVAADGTVLDPAGIIVAELDPRNNPEELPTSGIDIVWNGTSFLVTWADRDDSYRFVKGARVTPQGVVLDALPKSISTLSDTARRPSVAWSGVVHMVAWGYEGFYSDSYATRVDVNGNRLDWPPLFLGQAEGQFDPSIAWTGQEFLVFVGSAYRTVTAAGVPLQPNPVSFGINLVPRSLSCNGTSCAFTAYSNGALRLYPFDAATKSIGASSVISNASAPSTVAWDGTKFLVVHGNGDLTAWTVGATPTSVESGLDVSTNPRLASLGGGKSLLVYGRRGAVPGTVPRIHATLIDSSGAPSGTLCSIATDCASGFCTDGVCCDTACGAGSATDCQACSVAAGALTDGVCMPFAAGTMCRAASGPCDAAETCDGLGGSCPGDALLSGTPCRGATGPCDAVELCSGMSAQCPSDAAVSPGTPCVGTPNECVTQACSGTVGASAVCLSTPKLAGTVCRSAVNQCDAAEVCDGTGAPCPPDMLRPVGAVCRSAAGPCDLEEACDGASAVCPADAKVVEGTECRGAASECDVAEACDGTDDACPTDLGAPSGTVCGDLPSGRCALPSTCAGGTSKTCEAHFEPAGTTCRSSNGPCDAVESCDGASAECAPDALREAGEVCAPKDPANDCDIDDVCDGLGVGCAPRIAGNGAECETSVGDSGTCDAGGCIANGEGGAGGGGSTSSTAASTSTSAGSSGNTSSTGGHGGGATTGSGEGGATTGSGDGSSSSGSMSSGGASDNGPSADDGGTPGEGCSCRTGDGHSGSTGVGALVIAAALAGSRRKRRASSTRGATARSLTIGIMSLVLAACGDDSTEPGTSSSRTSSSDTSSGVGAAGGAGSSASIANGTGGGAGTGGEGGGPGDPCQVDNGGCDAHATCALVSNVVECTCDPGFAGDGQTCDDIDECAAGSDDCSEHATCENVSGSFLCECVDGYQGDGVDCEDVDECATSADNCSAAAQCENVPGSFACTCNPGFVGDGIVCDDIDECATDNGGCSELASCTNTVGGRTCTCDPGYAGNGVTCGDVDECATDNGGCSPDATCENSVGARSCACNAGYLGDGLTCDDVDECASDNGGCATDATCSNLPGTRSCSCNAGYVGDGLQCSDVDECAAAPSPCAAEATCSNAPGGFSCTCDPPYAGDGFTCSCALPAPVADAGASPSVAIGQSFQLDGTGSTGGDLVFQWTPIGNAPALANANTAQPSSVASTCVAQGYRLTVTDACGRTSSDTVTVQPPANGPYVSADTCSPQLQCGSVANPWCTISSGVSNSATSPVMVAAASTAYAGSSMRDGFDVLGGYESSFTAARNPDPLTNGTVVATQASAFTWTLGVDAMLDGFRIRAEHTTGPLPGTVAVLVVSGGEAVITNVDIDGPAAVYGSDVAALRVTGEGSALVEGASVLRGPRGSTRSVGAHVADNGTIDLADDATLQGGAAPESYGLRHVGVERLVLTGGIVAGGAGTAKSAGIVAGGVNYLGTSITSTTVLGGTAPEARGILHNRAPDLTIVDAIVHAQGATAYPATACGVHVDETTTIFISGSQIKGTTSPAPAGGGPAWSVGVRLGQTSLLDATATITQSDVEGGSIGIERFGIQSFGVPFTLSEGVTAGTNALAPDGRSMAGVDVRSGFLPGHEVLITRNTSVVGGTGALDHSGGVAGIALQAPYVSLRVIDNELIQGATRPGVGVDSTSGITITPRGSYGTYVIEGNGAIVGGPILSGDSAGITAYGDVSGEELLPLVIQNNELIAGNVDPTTRPEVVYGLRLRQVEASILDNQRILGGYAKTSGQMRATGMELGVNVTEYSYLEIAGNTIHGGSGTGTRGIRAVGMEMLLHDNVIDPCGLEGPPGVAPPDCLPEGSSTGISLQSDTGSHIFNNYVFGGYGGSAVACLLDTGVDIFEHNLCLVHGQPMGLAIALKLGWTPTIVRNNILDAGSANHPLLLRDRVAVEVRSSGFTLDGPELTHNELILDPACAVSFSTASSPCRGTTVEALNELNEQNGIVAYGNVQVPMGFLAPNRLHPTAAGYHLDASCVLQGLALPTALATDFDGDPRSLLTIGPDECSP